jgi:iron transport multicopper oxidase
MVEAPLQLQAQKTDNNASTLNIPQNHWDVCSLTNTPTEGNAAGNTKDWLDLTGANTSVPPLPAGFTAKGVVALVFSAISAVLGMCVIGWYGSLPITKGSVSVRKAGGEKESVVGSEVQAKDANENTR